MSSYDSIVDDAIKTSITENRIVHITHLAHQSQEWKEIEGRLSMMCEDWSGPDNAMEFWGEDDDGREWRVHLIAD